MKCKGKDDERFANKVLHSIRETGNTIKVLSELAILLLQAQLITGRKQKNNT